MTITDTPPEHGAAPPANGHSPAIPGPFILDQFQHSGDAPAKIEPVAEARRTRVLRQRWSERRARRQLARAEAQAKRLRDVAGTDDVDLTRWYPALIWLAVGVVAVTFALSYHGLFEYAHNIAYLPTELALVVPIGVDVFSLCSLVATFLCRDAHWRVRAYCWTIFGLTVAVSVAGNAMYAAAEVGKRHAASQVDRWTTLDFGAVAGAAVWPAFSAAALHLLIVARRHLSAQRARSATAAAVAEAAAAAEQLKRARAIELAAAGRSCVEIAEEIDQPKRTVERWTAEVRAALAARPAAPPKTSTRAKTN